MKIFAIGDLHLDGRQEKPMDIFGENWLGHEDKIFESWREKVTDDDLVLMPGDISWAMKLKDAQYDLQKIDALPGRKIMIRGNHDYWWESKNKMSGLDLSSIDFIVRDTVQYEKIAVCGVRGWFNVNTSELDESLSEEEKTAIEANRKHNLHIFNRELGRLENSVNKIKDFEGLRIAMLHYPPFKINGELNEFAHVLEKGNIDICLYGHLHGEDGHKLAKEGKYNGVEYICVSSDFLDFKLKEISGDSLK